MYRVKIVSLSPFTSTVKLNIKYWKSSNSVVSAPRNTQTTKIDTREKPETLDRSIKCKQIELVIKHLPTENKARTRLLW